MSTYFVNTKGPFLYYVSNCRVEGVLGSESYHFCLFSVLNLCLQYLVGEGGQKCLKKCLNNTYMNGPKL